MWKIGFDERRRYSHTRTYTPRRRRRRRVEFSSSATNDDMVSVSRIYSIYIFTYFLPCSGLPTIEPQQAICGNGVVDPGEECDCGWEEDCKDTCCFPMTSHPLANQKPCTLTPRASCSPSQGPCCTTECTLKFGDRCRDDNGCRDPNFCDGRMPHCPPSINKPNKTICNKESVCYMGECTGSICLAYGLESCQCIPTEDDPRTKACELCCKLPGEGNECKSSFAWNELPYDVPDMYAKPGTPCNDYNG